MTDRTETPPAAELRPLDVSACRRQFPALERQHEGRPVIYLDGPAGSQVPRRVAAAVGRYMLQANANHGGVFATSRESDALLDDAHRAVADLLGCDDPGCVAFGANMTTLTFAMSRALARTWQAGDEVLVTRLEHDANFTPWVLAACDAGARVQYVEINPDDCTLNLDDLRAKLSDRTRLVAVCCAQNAVGTVNPVAEITRLAHEAGALVFLDAVHYAPHRLMDVAAWGCDLLACSAYKFFGPHVGVLYGRRELLESLQPYKLRTAPDDLPGRWMTGTQNHEGIIGTAAAVDYLAELGLQVSAGEPPADRRAALRQAMCAIQAHEEQLAAALLRGLEKLPQWKVWGLRDEARLGQRVPTIGITHKKLPAVQVAQRLADRGIFAWHGNFYALPLTETLGLEPEGLVRLGLLHYNTVEEVERVVEELRVE